VMNSKTGGLWSEETTSESSPKHASPQRGVTHVLKLAD
jgi:hypothetical protein